MPGSKARIVKYPRYRHHPILDIPVDERPAPEICPECGHRCWACGRCGWRIFWDTEGNKMPGTTMENYSISGDWTEIAPGIRVRLRDAPNEEDMVEFYERPPSGIVILEVEDDHLHFRPSSHRRQV